MKLHLSKHVGLFGLLAAALCLLEIWVVSTALSRPGADSVALAITLDLLAGLPLLYYLLVVRPGIARPAGAGVVALAALALLSLILPAEHRSFIDALGTLLPLIELLVIGLLLHWVRLLIKHFRLARPTVIYPTDAAEISAREALGGASWISILVTEALLLYYSLAGWFIRFKAAAGQQVFSYHRNGYSMVLGMLVFLVLLETGGVHLIVQHWNPTAAWILTSLSIYTLWWLVGDYNAMRLQPIVLTESELHLRAGLRWRAAVALSDVLAVRKPARSDAKASGYLSMVVFGEPRMIVELARPVTVQGLFGRQRQAQLVGLSVDDTIAFQAELRRRAGLAG